MNEPEFKAGDLVYYPRETSKICRLKYNDCGHDTLYLWTVEAYDGSETYLNVDEEGKDDYECLTAVIFHTTEDNYTLLRNLHGVEFEKPKTKPTPKEIIKHLLTKQKYVVCQVSDCSENDARLDEVYDIVCAVDGRSGKRIDEFYAYEGLNEYWRFAIPYDLQGNEITSIDD